MARCKGSLQVDIPRLFVVTLITAAVLSPAGQGTAFASAVCGQGTAFASAVCVADANDNAPSIDSIGRELILSVPEHANASYVIATLKAPQEGTNISTHWSLTIDSSDTFSVNNGELLVKDPNKLQGYHVFNLTLVAADGNRTCNDSYFHIKIFVVDDVYYFVLPTPLPVEILTHHSQYVIQELGDILRLRLTAHNENSANYNSSDSERSYIVFEAFEMDTNDTVRVNTSDIGMRIAKESEKISSLFRFLSSFLKSTSDSKDSEYSLNALSKILVGVACLLFLIILAVVIIACRLRKSCCRHGDSCVDTFSCCKHGDSCVETLGCCTRNDSWSESSCCRRRDSVSDETPLSQTNWSLKDTERHSVPAFEFPEHIEPSELTQTSQSEKPPMVEVRKDTFSMEAETWSLGLNTVTRREHFLDRQMQKLQELFQALVDDLSQSEDALYQKLDNDELQLSLSDKQDTLLPGQRSTASEAAKSGVAVTESSGTDISKPETQDSGSNKTQLYPRITLEEDGKLDFATIQPSDGVQQENTLMLHPATAGLVLPQTSHSDVSNEHHPFGESNTSRASGFMPQKSTSDVTNQNSSFEESNESQISSTVTKDSEDGHIFTSFRRTDPNINIQLPNSAKSQVGKPSNAVLQNTNRNIAFENSTTSRTPPSFTQDSADGHVTLIYRTDGELQLPHRVMSVGDKLPHPVMSAADKLPHPVTSAADKLPHPVMSAADKLPHPVTSAADKLPHPVMSAADKLPHPVMSAADKLIHPVMSAADKLPHPVMSAADKLTHPVMSAADEPSHGAPRNADRVVQEEQRENKTNKPDWLFPTNTRSLDPLRELLHDEDVVDILDNILANENVGDTLDNENVGDILGNENVGDILGNENVGDILANDDVGDSPGDEDAVTHF